MSEKFRRAYRHLRENNHFQTGASVVVLRDIFRLPSNLPDLSEREHELYAAEGEEGVIEGHCTPVWFWCKHRLDVQVRMRDKSLKTFRATSLTVL